MKQKDRSKLIKKMDTAFSKIIRSRDGKCLRCGNQTSMQCAHIVPRQHYHLRWDEKNAICLCYACHIYWAHKDPLEFSLWITNLLGEETIEYLKNKRIMTSKVDIEEIWKQLQEKSNLSLKRI